MYNRPETTFVDRRLIVPDEMHGWPKPLQRRIRYKEMAILLTFLFGIGNFAVHKAVLESGHPVLRQLPWMSNIRGGRFSLGLEFLVLLGALLLVGQGATGWAWGYAAYTLLNGFSGWLILTHRV